MVVPALLIACGPAWVDSNCGLVIPDRPGSGDAAFGAVFNRQNFAWQPSPIQPTLDVDYRSITSHSALPAADVEVVVAQAVEYWNSAGANFSLSIAGVECTDSDYGGAALTGDRTCFVNDDGHSTLGLWHDRPSSVGAGEMVGEFEERSVKGSAQKHKCLVAADVRLYDIYDGDCVADDGVSVLRAGPLSTNWVLRNADVTDRDCSDGTKDKPLYDTVVHELGHLVGLSHAEVTDSVMWAEAGGTMDWNTIGAVDKAAVRTLYP